MTSRLHGFCTCPSTFTREQLRHPGARRRPTSSSRARASSLWPPEPHPLVFVRGLTALSPRWWPYPPPSFYPPRSPLPPPPPPSPPPPPQLSGAARVRRRTVLPAGRRAGRGWHDDSTVIEAPRGTPLKPTRPSQPFGAPTSVGRGERSVPAILDGVSIRGSAAHSAARSRPARRTAPSGRTIAAWARPCLSQVCNAVPTGAATNTAPKRSM